MRESYKLLIDLIDKDRHPNRAELAKLVYTYLYILDYESITPSFIREAYIKTFGKNKDRAHIKFINRLTHKKIGMLLSHYKSLFKRIHKFADKRFLTYYCPALPKNI